MRSPIVQRPAFNDDGTPRRKYELEPQTAPKAAMRIAFTMVLANALVLAKSILFGDDAAKAHSGQGANNPDGDRLNSPVDTFQDADAKLVTDASQQDAASARPAPVSAFVPQTFLSTSTFFGSSALPYAPGQRPGADLPGAGNDNVALYRASPGRAIDLTLDEGFRSHAPSARSDEGASAGHGASVADAIGSALSQARAPVLPPSPTDSATATTDPVSGGDTPAGDGRPRANNRLPTVTGPVFLGTLLSGQTVVLALRDFLARATDPDGDAMSVTGLTATGATIDVHADAGLVFISDFGAVPELIFTYGVSDGLGETAQTAMLDLLPSAGIPITGTVGTFDIIGTAGNDQIDGTSGSHVIVGRGGHDNVYASPGNDRIIMGAGDDVVHAGEGDDVVFAGAGKDVVFGGGGNDIIFGDEGDDVLLGEAGDDTISGGAGNDIIDGGSGNDNLSGDEGNDLILGGAGDDSTAGGSGDDVIDAGGGDDGAAGGSGNDTFIATAQDGDDHYNGGSGIDTYDASAITADIHVDLAAGTIDSATTGHDTVVEIENVVAGTGDDIIAGNDDGNQITGNGGDDDVDTKAGDDTVIATAQDGDDHYNGGSGTDTYDAAAITADMHVDLAAGTIDSADTGHDTVVEIENVIAGTGDDIIVANDEVNVLSGGGGDDTFVFFSVEAIGKGHGSRDKILDFEVGDRIDLDNISREFAELIDQTFTDSNIRRFVLIGQQDKFAEPGQMKIQYEEVDGVTSTLLMGNINYDEDTEFQLEITGIHDLKASDFVTHL